MKKTLAYGCAVILLSAFLISSCKKNDVIPDLKPLADAGTSQTIRLPQDTVLLSGSGSEPKGKVAAFLWSEISGPNSAQIQFAGSPKTAVRGLIAGTYLFQLMVVDTAGETGLATVTITVVPPQYLPKYLYLRPGPTDNNDIVVVNVVGIAFDAGNNYANSPEISASEWTYSGQGGGEGTFRGLLKFNGLSAVLPTSIVDSAFISFYGLPSYAMSPQGNSYYPGSPYNTYGDNKCWIQKITSTWDYSTVTWNNQPSSTSVNQVEMAASTSQMNYNATHIDVTNLVKDMVANPSQGFGFLLKQQSETIYRNMNFASSRAVDSTKRPLLQVYYKALQ